jgi:hypothetical protein
MPRTRISPKKLVKDTITKDTLKNIVKFVKKGKNHMWGLIKNEDDFVEKMTILTIYKDLTGIGYKTLQKESSDWTHISQHSLQHNVPEIRKKLAEWGRKTDQDIRCK